MTAIVTGASRGIGRATALELARRGVPVVLVGRALADLDATAEGARSHGVRVDTIACDLRDPADIARSAAQILADDAAPTALLHIAGIVHRTRVVQMTDGAWAEQLDVNLRAPFLLTRALLPSMLAAGRGRIVFVSSISATLGTAGGSAYCASKWGLVGFMKSLAEELSGTGVTTVSVLPGSVDTEMLVGSGFSPRMAPEDVARTIAYHALDAPSAHNGGVVEMFGT